VVVRTKILLAIGFLFAHDGSVNQGVVKDLVLSVGIQTLIPFWARCNSAFLYRQTALTWNWKVSKNFVGPKNGSTVAAFVVEMLTFLKSLA
jgi:hypothetical protein